MSLKNGVPSSKVTSLLTLVETMAVVDLKNFDTRSDPVLRKMLILIAQTIIVDLVVKNKRIKCVRIAEG